MTWNHYKVYKKKKKKKKLSNARKQILPWSLYKERSLIWDFWPPELEDNKFVLL